MHKKFTSLGKIEGVSVKPRRNGCRCAVRAFPLAFGWHLTSKYIVVEKSQNLSVTHWQRAKQCYLINKLRFVTYAIIQSIINSEICSLHLTHPSTHTWSSGQPALRHPGSSWGFSALRQFLPQPRFEPTTSDYKSDALSIRATTAPLTALFSAFNPS